MRTSSTPEASPPSALSVARLNARQHGVESRMRFVQCDLVHALTGPVDLVISNPPYIAEEEWADLPPSVHHEPRLALDGGPDGLEVIRRLLSLAPRLLRPGGALLIEMGATQGEQAAALARALQPDASIAIHPDLTGRHRVLEVEPAIEADYDDSRLGRGTST